jgi:anhydro-N-acetylmuramic acid kinase
VTDELIVGMLSGTSLDGVDAVLVNFSNDSMDILHARCTPYPPAIKTTLEQLLGTGAPPTQKVAEMLDENLAFFFARVAQDLVRETGLEMRDIRVIGSHGQNVWHQPRGRHTRTIQLGRGDLIARNTGTTVVNNFRRADVKAGGEGAPLAPLLHRNLFHSESEDRAILNLGGIANLTLLPANSVASGFDCGPGNCLMDGWAKRHLHKDYDDDGHWASKGEIDSQLLSLLLNDPYFSKPPPKSTGLEYFNLSWLDQQLGENSPVAVNVQTTLAELSAQSIALGLATGGLPGRLMVCGGGVHNVFLMRRIAAALPDVVVESTANHGADPDWVEGLLFAWLARERLAERLQDTTAITGADHPVLLGDIHDPPGIDL